jgi:CheY-like chemotaxis protein
MTGDAPVHPTLGGPTDPSGSPPHAGVREAASPKGGSYAGYEDGSGLVLVVDDDLVALELAVDVLGSAGYPVSGVSTVAAAVDAARRAGTGPPCSISDSTGGRPRGRQGCAAIRRCGPSVVVWSASTPEDLSRARAAGCNAFLAKRSVRSGSRRRRAYVRLAGTKGLEHGRPRRPEATSGRHDGMP